MFQLILLLKVCIEDLLYREDPFQCLVNVNYRVLICCACHFQSGSPFFVYFGFLCLQVSSVSNFCPDTGGGGGHLSRLPCSAALRGGRNPASKHHWRVWECSQCMDHTGFAPTHSGVCFPSLHCSGSAGVLSRAGPAFCALPRSKLLRFGFLGTLQMHRLGWACVLCPSQVQAAQVTRCLARTLPQVDRVS